MTLRGDILRILATREATVQDIYELTHARRHIIAVTLQDLKNDEQIEPARKVRRHGARGGFAFAWKLRPDAHIPLPEEDGHLCDQPDDRFRKEYPQPPRPAIEVAMAGWRPQE